MLNYILIRHKVKDFTSWKRVYDGHLPRRNEAGLTEKFMFRGVGDQNEVIMLFETKDLGRAKKFIESVDLRETMGKSGVLDKPDIYFLTEEKAVAYAKASGF
jgi:hypothetical protein